MQVLPSENKTHTCIKIYKSEIHYYHVKTTITATENYIKDGLNVDENKDCQGNTLDNFII
ncbi:hypothetical protein V1477_009942 [Vespula maculifrons]|uniref:Uncharacterized protein n=1 Tax=Vespula maculifrons TaxID=7453 RepID=A0ABD2CB69_VESMC